MYRSQYRCSDCKYQFEKITKRIPRKDPDCPKCKRVQRVKFKSSVSDATHEMNSEVRVQQMIESRQPPSTGKSNFTKAMDATSEMVMKDYGLTNLQDNLREGDTMVPKLRPELEQRVDQVFKPQKPIAGAPVNAALNKTLMNQINAGKFKGYGGASDVVARQQNSGIRVPTNILFEDSGKRKPN